MVRLPPTAVILASDWSERLEELAPTLENGAIKNQPALVSYTVKLGLGNRVSAGSDTLYAYLQLWYAQPWPILLMELYLLLTSRSTLLQPTRATVAMSSVEIGRGLAWKQDYGLDRSQLASVSIIMAACS